MRRMIRYAVVTALVAYALLGVYSAASALWQPRGTLGLSADYDAGVRFVSPGGPAALAGIAAGDRLDLAATGFAARRYVAGAGIPPPIGTLVTVRFTHRGVTSDVRLAAVRNEPAAADRFAVLLECVASLLFVVVGSSLMLLRPSLATWGFGFYCLLVPPAAAYQFRPASALAAFGAIALYDVVQNLGVVGLLVFALEFPRSYPSLWRERLRRSVPPLFVLLAAMTLYPDVANLLLGTSAGIENRLLQIAFGTVFALALYVLWDTNRRIPRDEHARLRWVLIGFGAGLATNYVGSTLLFSSLIPIAPPVWLTNVLVSLNVLLPLTVAHAVVRHRVLDIDFVVSRALVYAALTTVLAVVFGLLDWFFGHFLEDFRLSRLVEAGIAVGVAFAFDTLHKRAEETIEAIFFRRRRAAELRLQRLMQELPLARSARVVDEALVGEAAGALELQSAAVFRSVAGPAFERTASLGWEATDCVSLDDTDLLVLSLRAKRAGVELAALPWRRADIPGGGRAPAFALPMYSRADLAGVILYGGHAGGGDIDPSERLQLEGLAHAAAIALDELEAERLRAETALQTSAIRELTARLDELRRLHLQPDAAPPAAR